MAAVASALVVVPAYPASVFCTSTLVLVVVMAAVSAEEWCAEERRWQEELSGKEHAMGQIAMAQTVAAPSAAVRSAWNNPAAGVAAADGIVVVASVQSVGMDRPLRIYLVHLRSHSSAPCCLLHYPCVPVSVLLLLVSGVLILVQVPK